jgi:hypothetical protein
VQRGASRPTAVHTSWRSIDRPYRPCGMLSI